MMDNTRTIARHLAVLLAALCGLLLSSPVLAQAVADWGNLGATSLGPVTSPSTISASDGTSVQVSHSSVSVAPGTNTPTYGGSFVAYFSGTIGSATQVLLLNMDNSSYDPNDKITTNITLGRAVTGLQFTLNDIDNGNFRDSIEVYYDTGNGVFQNAANTAALYSFGSAVQRTNNTTVNGWTGINNSDQFATDGTISFNFGTTAIKAIRIVYFSYSGFGDPGSQYIGVSGLSFNAPEADLSLTKAFVGTAPTNGGSATFRLTIKNANTSTLTANSIKVTDVLPAGFTFTSASGGGTYNSTSGIWSITSLAPGASATIDINGTVNASAGATITNIAEITASSAYDSDSTPNNANTTEDDYASASFTVAGARVAGTLPAFSCPAGSTLFDWAAISWNAGSTANTYPLGSLGNIGFALTNDGQWLNNATYGGQSPTRSNVINGGSNDYGLTQLVDMPNQSTVATTVISLPAIMEGARFTLFDVDYAAGQFADRVTISGSKQGVAVAPTLTNGAANYVIGATAYGDSGSNSDENLGNVTVTFSQPIDRIVIQYGNHSLAPTNPGQQGITIHDITVCNPATKLTVAKTSTLMSDPVNGVTAPKAIPGAILRYCILVSNPGATSANTIIVTDTIPSGSAFIPGSIKSGASCANATTTEDDNNTGADESDPVGASFSGGTISATTSSLNAGAALAITFQAVMTSTP